MNESFFEKLKMVRGRDLLHIFIFLLALLPAAVYRRRRKHLWLVCEKGQEAGDNGFAFFRYLRQHQPQVDAVYAIAPHCPQEQKVAALGPVVAFGSLRHWIYYLAAEVNVSSQKDGKPNAAVCYLMEVVLKLPLGGHSVFLQHGVIKDDLPFLHREKTNFRIFCCGALPEYEYVRDHFGYGPGVVQYTGLCRFDALHGLTAEDDLVLIMPTWRMEWQRCGDGEKFRESPFFLGWQALLTDENFRASLRKYGKKAVFCMHRNMEAFEPCFAGLGCEEIRILPWKEARVDQLIHRAGTLITDYSSVAMDFAYLHRPLFYYQFDYENFRARHLPEGYFDYERDGFGPVISTPAALTERLTAAWDDPAVCREYQDRADRFYPLHDTHHCERTYLAVTTLLGQETL